MSRFVPSFTLEQIGGLKELEALGGELLIRLSIAMVLLSSGAIGVGLFYEHIDLRLFLLRAYMDPSTALVCRRTVHDHEDKAGHERKSTQYGRAGPVGPFSILPPRVRVRSIPARPHASDGKTTPLGHRKACHLRYRTSWDNG